MAKQTKRIRKNIASARELEETLAQPERPKYKPWENILLVAVICLTLFLLTSGWDFLDDLNRGMYGSLLVALLLMYAQRRMTLSGSQMMWLGRAIFLFITVSLILFGCAVYFEHFAS